MTPLSTFGTLYLLGMQSYNYPFFFVGDLEIYNIILGLNASIHVAIAYGKKVPPCLGLRFELLGASGTPMSNGLRMVQNIQTSRSISTVLTPPPLY